MIWRCDLVPQYTAYKKEINTAVSRVLESGRYVLAGEVAQFEEEFANYIGARRAVAVASGTDALILAMKALEIGPGDDVITTPFTAIPTVSAIIAIGARPVFVDICPDSYLIDIGLVKEAITYKTKAIIPVHIFGNVVDIPKLRLAIGERIRIIEDACQAHGSSLNGAKAGTMGDISAFSFYPTKNLGGYGDGGAITTNDEEIADRVRLLRMYGMEDYNHITINGVNSRLDEIQAAILRIKLRHLDEMNNRRNAIASRYNTELNRSLFTPQAIQEQVKSNCHVYCVTYKRERYRLMKDLEEKGIQTNVYYLMPIYAQKANAFLGIENGACPVAENVCAHVMALPMYAELLAKDHDKILQTIKSCEAQE